MPNKTSLIAKPAETGRITLREHAIPRDPFDENVYNILPDVIHIPDKKAMYKSIFAGDVKFQEKKGRKDAASMGPIKVHVNPPKEFLKKHTGNALVKSGTFYLYSRSNKERKEER